VIETKAEEVSAVAEAFGMKTVHKLGLPTTRLDTIPLGELIAGVRSVVEEVRPHVVYLVHPGDVHTDHRIVFDAALSALKPWVMTELGIRCILTFETLSSTEAAPPQLARVFVPTVYRNVASYIDRKIEIMSLFRTEAQSEPMPRAESAIRALARYRGASVGLQYAEGFMLIREID
jgi:LmbE family N-acetylglucosaminyl deacetylase